MRKREKLKAGKRLEDHVGTFHRSLGRFVSAFSLVEATLLRVLWVLARMESPYAQAVLSGVRIEGAMGYINRIAEAERWPDDRKKDWQRIFSQIGLINKLRNDILHHGVSMVGDARVVTNERVAHHPSRVREVHITPKILENASDDLYDLFVILTLYGGPRVGEVYPRDRGARIRRLRRGTWRYKQLPQADWQQMILNNLQKLRPPLGSSRA